MGCRSRAAILERPLTQIHRRYKASCYDLQMTVENANGGWKVEVHGRGEKLHCAHRCSLDAAKLAATEFAVLRMTGGTGAATVEIMAKHLPWSESW